MFLSDPAIWRSQHWRKAFSYYMKNVGGKGKALFYWPDRLLYTVDCGATSDVFSVHAWTYTLYTYSKYMSTLGTLWSLWLISSIYYLSNKPNHPEASKISLDYPFKSGAIKTFLGAISKKLSCKTLAFNSFRKVSSENRICFRNLKPFQIRNTDHETIPINLLMCHFYVLSIDLVCSGRG
jgi:hypothetical protein